jgi:hypothetical protein
LRGIQSPSRSAAAGVWCRRISRDLSGDCHPPSHWRSR